MTEPEWSALVQSGQQAGHQARELLRRPLSAWEVDTLQATWQAWAAAVLGLQPPDTETPEAPLRLPPEQLGDD